MSLKRLHTITLLTALAASTVLASTDAARSAELKVIAPNAVKEAVAAIGARHSKEKNTEIAFTWAGSEAIAKRVGEGEAYDVVLTTSAGIDKLAGDGKLDPKSKADFSRSAVAAAVRAGLPRPDISTVDGLKKSLLDAKSIAISSGASGRYLEGLFKKLGVAEQVQAKIKQPPSGAQIGDMLASGEADLGFQQVTELIHAKGFDYLGTLPAELQNYTVWSAAVHARAADAKAAGAFVAALAAPGSAQELSKTGLEPVAK